MQISTNEGENTGEMNKILSKRENRTLKQKIKKKMRARKKKGEAGKAWLQGGVYIYMCLQDWGAFGR